MAKRLSTEGGKRSIPTGVKTMKSLNPMTIVTALLILVGGASVALAQTVVPVVDEHHLDEPNGATTAASDDLTMPAPPVAEGGMPGTMGMMEMMGPQMMQMMQMMGEMQEMQQMRMQQMEQMQDRMQQMMQMGSAMGMGAGADLSAMMMGRGMAMCPMMMPGMMSGSGMGMGSGAMMDSQGTGGMMGGMGMSAGVSREMTPELVREWLTQRLSAHGGSRVTIGDVVTAEDGSIVAEIVTVDGSLVHKLAFNRYPGLFREVE
jgi:hypothetical protein